MIRTAAPRDINGICEIYNHYILHSHATFETKTIEPEEMAVRVDKVQSELQLPWIVIEADAMVVGYAYATQWKPRAAYAKTVETTVYMHHEFQGKGLGKRIYQSLIDELDQRKYHALLGGISMPNDGSVRLHESLGFVKVGQLKEVGYKFDRWIDVGYWELLL